MPEPTPQIATDFPADPSARLRRRYAVAMSLLAVWILVAFGAVHFYATRRHADKAAFSAASEHRVIAQRISVGAQVAAGGGPADRLRADIDRLERTDCAEASAPGLHALRGELLDAGRDALTSPGPEAAARVLAAADALEGRADEVMAELAQTNRVARERQLVGQVVGIVGGLALIAVVTFGVFGPAVRGLRRLLATERAAAGRALAAERAKTLFLQNMNHQVRTPLAALLGYADLLLDPGLGPEQRTLHVQSIRRAAARLETLVCDVLDMVAIQAGSVPVRPETALARRAVEIVASRFSAQAAAKGLTLRVEQITPLPDRLRVDHEHLAQALSRLVDNAVANTKEGGVLLTVGFVPDAPGRGWLNIEVTDTGPGIPPERADEVFVAFHHTDAAGPRPAPGAGLGLSIARGLARCMGGDVSLVHSCTDENHGSVFLLRVPVEPAEGAVWLPPGEFEPAAPRSPATAHAPLTLRGRVLVAEDGPDNQRLIAHHLKALGLGCEIVEDGRQAVDRALSAAFRREPFDVILMDMQMPVLDGYAATSLLRQSGYAGPVLALTAHAGIADRERSLCAGCDDHLTKPVDRFALSRALAQYLPPDDLQAPEVVEQRRAA
jgi:signal transduction histidine kinase/CheY-like chemotaxis protein